MSIKSHIVTELESINRDEFIEPGVMVRHVNLDRSFGLCLSRYWAKDASGNLKNQPMQCDVLWTVGPVTPPDVGVNVASQTINTPVKVLKARWSIDNRPDVGGFDSIWHNQQQVYEVTEEYPCPDDALLARLKAESIEFAAEYDINGLVTVHRTTTRKPDMLLPVGARQRKISTRVR